MFLFISKMAFLLHEKLAALPRYRFDKEPIRICAQPELSSVSEVSESDDRHSLNTTFSSKVKQYGVRHMKVKRDKKVSSDGDTTKTKPPAKVLSPAQNNDHSTSCLMLATLGSDESVINDTLERLPKNKEICTDNIIDLLIEEALHSKNVVNKDNLEDSGINTAEKKSQDFIDSNEAIENTPLIEDLKVTTRKTLIGRDTFLNYKNKDLSETDESTTETVNEEYLFVNTRKKSSKEHNKVDTDKCHLKKQEIDDFFQQNAEEINAKEIVISPTLAKKINETSSESSFGEDVISTKTILNNVNTFEVNDAEILECLNSMVNIVCNELDKCSEYLRDEINKIDTFTNFEDNVQLEKPMQEINTNKKSDKKNTDKNLSQKQLRSLTKQEKVLKPKYEPVKPKRPTRKTKTLKQNTVEKPTVSPIIEEENAVDEFAFNESPKVKQSPVARTDDESALIRKKRKLYSPKDETTMITKTNVCVPETEEDDTNNTQFKSTSLNLTPKISATTSYKELDTIRRKNIRQKRNRKSKGKMTVCLSPRTIKINDVFDHLKEKVDNDEKIILADKDLAVYNFTSDSEDEDFKQKKSDIQKRISTTTIGSADSALSRHGRPVNRINYTENKNSSSTDDNKQKKQLMKRKRTTKRQNNKGTLKKEIKESHNKLIDERMREAVPDVMDTSFVEEKTKDKTVHDPEPVIKNKPEMEPINNESSDKTKAIEQCSKKTKRNKKTTQAMSLKKEKETQKTETNKIVSTEQDRTVSPLPGLVVETVPKFDDGNDSLTANMIQKFKKIYENGTEDVNITNTTYNLPSEIEGGIYSPTRNIDEVVLSEFNKKTNANTKRSKKSQKQKDESNFDSTSVTENLVVVDISDITEVKRDKSIDTVGHSPITGHGDLDEAPPSPEMLRERFEPRNLEIQDLDISIQNYFGMLSKECNRQSDCSDSDKKLSRKTIKAREIKIEMRNCNLPSNSKQLKKKKNTQIKETKQQEKHKLGIDSQHKKSSKSSTIELVQYPSVFESKRNRSSSPTVSKISTSEMRKWLPSPRSSTYSEASHKTIVSLGTNIELEKAVCRSPVVSVKRLSSEEISKWIPANKTDSEACFQKDEVISLKKVKYKNQKGDSSNTNLTEHISSENQSQDTNSNGTGKLILPTTNCFEQVTPQIKRSKTKGSNIDNIRCLKDFSDKRIQSQETIKSTYRRSVISPVKLFEDMFNLNKEPETRLNLSRNNSGSDKENVSVLPKERSTNKKINKREVAPQKVNKSVSQEKDTPLRKRKPLVLEYSTKKRRLAGDEQNVETMTISDSGPSVSSVNEWFRRNDSVQKDPELAKESLREGVQHVLEKLDTTLSEIHESTSKKLVHMFVDAQTQITKVQEERRGLLKRTAADILSSVVKLLDEKFADIDQRSEELDRQFKEELKRQACSVLREDCKQKRNLVLLLREDLQAFMENSERE